MMNDQPIAIVGTGNTDYLRKHDKGLMSLVVEAGRKAIAESGLPIEDIDGMVVPAGMPPTDEIAVGVGIRHLSYKVINAYTPGAGAVASIVDAAMAIQSGRAKAVLVAYGIKTSVPGGPYEFHARDPLKADLEMPVGYYGQPLYFAALAQRYRHQYGLTEEQLGAVAVAQRQWAALTPGAQKSESIELVDYLQAPLVAEPLRTLDCCLISDGAGAVVVTSAERAATLPGIAVEVAGAAVGSHPWTLTEMFTQSPDMLELGPAEAGRRAFAQAGISHADVDVLQVYDCFTLSVLLQLESLGFCERGKAAAWVENGRTAPGGQLPVNTDGGHLCNGYIPGITHLLEGVRQLRGERGAAQVEGAQVGVVTTFGGPDHATLVLKRIDR